MSLFKNITFANVIDNYRNTFFRGVVENRNDSKKLGRVQVRILGIHSNDVSKVPTESLPWAEVLVPNIFQGQMSGIGVSNVPLEGTWVWIFLENSDFNKPIVIGFINGVSQNTKPFGTETGFWDQNGKYPLQDRLNESDINRLSRNEKITETLISKVRSSNKEMSIPTASGSSWDEAEETSSKAKYPNNTVIETPSGNLIEYDDTEGNSRIHFFHKTGTYWEMIENGDYNQKVSQNKSLIVNKDSKNLVKGDYFITVNKNYEEFTGKNKTTLIGKNNDVQIKGSETYKVIGSQDVTINGSQDVSITGKGNQKYSAGLNIDGGPVVQIKASVIMLN